MPINVNLELTDHCNIKCPMCSQSLRDDAHGAPKRFMSWATWRALLTGLEDMDEEVHLCPHWLGEPTIHPEFDAFIEYAFTLNEDFRLFREFKLHTNAVVFDEDRARRLIDLAQLAGGDPPCFRTIHFSIDAFSAESYQKTKGADRREQVFRNVERFLRLRTDLGARAPLAHLAFVVQPDNFHEAGDFLDYWQTLMEELGLPLDVCFDWPSGPNDAVYFRPLNCGDQDEADRLHRQVCQTLGLVGQNAPERLRAAESF
jgi:molybdenum cofactor biosynthesis enzyme MoaA